MMNDAKNPEKNLDVGVGVVGGSRTKNRRIGFFAFLATCLVFAGAFLWMLPCEGEAGSTTCSRRTKAVAANEPSVAGITAQMGMGQKQQRTWSRVFNQIGKWNYVKCMPNIKHEKGLIFSTRS